MSRQVDVKDRPVRGLLDFVGELSHSLFGTARNSDISSVKQLIMKLKRRQDVDILAWQIAEGHLASFGKVVNHRLDTINCMVRREHSWVQSVLHDIMSLSSAQTRAGTILAMALNRLEQFTIMHSDLSQFQHGLQLLTTGILSPAFNWCLQLIYITL